MTTSQQLFEVIVPGRATCVFTKDFTAIHYDLEQWVESTPGLRLVGMRIDLAQPVSTLLEALLSELSEALLAVWPDWYGGDYPEACRPERIDVATLTAAICRDRPEVNRGWLRSAAESCQFGKPPTLKRISATVRARQMRLALAEQQLLLAISYFETDPTADRLLGLSRVSEWLARQADASVLVMVPIHLRTRSELDGINFQSIIWPPETNQRTTTPFDKHSGPSPEATPGFEWTGAEKPTTSMNSETPDTRSAARMDERKHLVCPILGRPHPASPGEQILDQYLARDRELGHLFRFNQRLETIFASRYLVDLVWSEGRVVVEVDGYGWHSTSRAFHADRQRDYELTLSGYLVLRLPHDLVVENPERACQRIREFVEFRRQHPFSHSR